ncbi:MAG: PHB depolymerase family esterase [Polyangiales bacterium]
MMFRWLWMGVLCGLGVCAWGCGSDDGSSASATSASPGCEGGTLVSTVTHVDLEFDGMGRSYEVHVPPSYDGTTPLPLVLSFHGFTSSGLGQQQLTQMNGLADREGFLVAYPNGLNASWNAGVCCGRSAESNVDDVGFTRALIDDIGGRGCIDRLRIYATGMSNGGFFSQRLACEAADIIAAVAPVASVLGIDDAACIPARPIPIIQFNGTGDPLVSYYGGGLTGSPSVEANTAGWIDRNGCTGEPVASYQNGVATCETVDQCADDASVTLCTIEGGGHCWPGYPCDQIDGLGESTTDIDANEVMWELFRRTALPQ